MKRRLALACLAVAILSADLALAGVTSGQIRARDKEMQTVLLSDGSVYYVPNRNWLSEMRPRRWVAIWYEEQDGLRVVVNHEIKNRE